MTLKRRKSISWDVEFPELKELAKRMRIRLHKKRPFGVEKGLDNAHIPHFSKQIIFGEKLLQRLENSEFLALAAHELTHLKQHHNCKKLLWIIILCAPISLLLSRTTTPDCIQGLIVIALLMITLIVGSRRYEYKADAGAVLHAGREPTLSLIRKTANSYEKWYRNVALHPSASQRIRKIEKSS